MSTKNTENLNIKFSVYELSQEFKKKPGVFILTYKYQENEKIKHDVLFVSHTDDMSNAYINIPNKDCLIKHKVNAICVYAESDFYKRKLIVADIIKQLMPKCNLLN